MRTFLATTLTVMLSTASAQMDHSTHSAGSTSKTQAMTMDMSSLGKLSGKAFDRTFLSMMIPHHQGAIDMANTALPAVNDPRVKSWANAVLADQQREIGQMNTLLKSYGGPDSSMQGMMKKGMSGMASSVKNASDKQRAFVQGMIPHHGSAIDMANLALQKSSNASVLKLARDIIRSQAQEMYDFQLWLKK